MLLQIEATNLNALEFSTAIPFIAINVPTPIGPSITHKDNGNSPVLTDRQLGQSIVFFQEFVIHEPSYALLSSTMSKLSDCPSIFNVLWTRHPHDLSESGSRYRTSCSLGNSSKLILNASLAVWNLNFTDEGFYEVKLSIDGCSSNCSTLYKLEIPNCNITNPPQSSKHYLKLVVAQPSPGRQYYVDIVFNGDNNEYDFQVQWMIGAKPICADTDNEDPKYSCTRQNLFNCTVTARLYIDQLTSKDSGKVSVQGWPVNSGDLPGNATTIDLSE